MGGHHSLISGGLLLAFLAAAQADDREARPDAKEDRIWGAVVFATNEKSPKEAPGQLEPIAGRLRRVFGYNQFEIIGSASEKIDDQDESWLVPSPTFKLGVRARKSRSKEARGGYLLNLRLYHEKRPLVDTEAKLAPGSPLIIRGPQYGKGQLLFVLQIQ